MLPMQTQEENDLLTAYISTIEDRFDGLMGAVNELDALRDQITVWDEIDTSTRASLVSSPHTAC